MKTEPDFISLLGQAAYGKKNTSSIYLDGKERFFAWKRVVDIGVSIIVLLAVLSWLTPILAVFIWLDSHGPVFFRQKRVGRGGKTFTCYKFRSMFRNPEADHVQAYPEDYRITRVGRFLRRTNLDELPQFMNVLKGQMSIIGPRPHMCTDHYRFCTLIKDYEFRNLLRPGITGLAQVRGYSGPTPDTESIFGRYQWDAFYVRNASFLLDMRIVKKTIRRQVLLWLPAHDFYLFTRK